MAVTSADHAVLKRVLLEFVAAGGSGRPLSLSEDSDYGVLYAFDITPCCIPLPSVAWLNPLTPGLFLRCAIASDVPLSATDPLVSYINTLNSDVPAGTYALDPVNRIVVYKHAAYFGSLPLTEELIVGVLSPAAELVGREWRAITELALGVAPEHRHPN